MPGPRKPSPTARRDNLVDNLLFRWQKGYLITNPKGRVKDTTGRLKGLFDSREAGVPGGEGGTGMPMDGAGGLGGGGYTLSFAETEAGARLSALYDAEQERARGRERLTLEGTIHSLARELLPPRDVGAAIQSVQRGELVKSKLAFQTAMQALQDRQEIDLRREELRQREQVEQATLKQARSKLVVDMIGRDLGRAILFALGTGEGQ